MVLGYIQGLLSSVHWLHGLPRSQLVEFVPFFPIEHEIQAGKPARVTREARAEGVSFSKLTARAAGISTLYPGTRQVITDEASCTVAGVA